MKLTLASLITLVAGITVVADYFVAAPVINHAASTFTQWSVMLSAFSTALGGVNLLAVHKKRLSQRSANWGLSVILLASMVAWLVIGLSLGTESSVYKFIWDNVYSSLSSTLFALNAFFIASAAYRSFRVKGIDTLILLVTACAVMLGRTGLGEAYRMPEIADWLIRVPNTAGMRGITIGGALGAISVSARVILGLERGYAGERRSGGSYQ
ncbi:MAG TPA: hypothetical protein GX512_08135 [Firmicutes bacterium]|nr:hypothetical protein [Candidatus Fermentithermobacillaceae bacterium]